MGPEAVSVEHPLNEVEVGLVIAPQRVLLGLYSDFPFGLCSDRIHLVRFNVCTVKQEGHPFGVLLGTRWEQRSEHQSKRIGKLLIVFKDTLVFPRRVLDLRAFLSKMSSRCSRCFRWFSRSEQRKSNGSGGVFAIAKITHSFAHPVVLAMRCRRNRPGCV